MNIALCGMMGVGKTTVGLALSKKLNRPFLDTDEIIVSRHGVISEIFETKGEAYFRDLETQVAHELEKDQGSVISTGGGFVIRKENADAIKKGGVLVFLNATKETVLSRVSADGRPLLKGGVEAKITSLIETRYPVYKAHCSLIVDTDHKTVEEVVDEIIERVGL